MGEKSEETVIFSCKPRLLAAVPFAAAGLALLVTFSAFGIWQLGGVFCGALLIYSFNFVVAGEITVTNFCVRGGRSAVPLGDITCAVCERDLAGKLFSYGTVVIYTSDKRLTFRGLPRAEKLRDIISKQVDLYHFRQTCRQAETARKLMSEEAD